MRETATKPKENPDEFLVEYTNRLIIQHLLLVEDHLLEYNREPTDQCLACLFWHLEKLIAYSSLECVKFEAMDAPTCQNLSGWSVRVQESIDGMTRDEALQFSKEAREFRYTMAEASVAQVSQSIIPDIGKAVITGVGIAGGFKLVDWVVERMRKSKAEEELREAVEEVKPEVTKLTGDIWNRMTPMGREQLGVKAGLDAEERGSRWIELWPEKKRALIREFKKEQELLVAKPPAVELMEEPRWCFGVKQVDRELGGLAKSLGIAQSKAMGFKKKLEVPIFICKGQSEMFASPVAVLDPYGSRCRDPESGQWILSDECGFEPTGISTSALGMDGLTHYDFEFKIVSLDNLVVSHDPFTFVPNPKYPKELQPRLRERAATKIQVEKIAANLEPDAVITDFHTLDRGAPIIGVDWVVEAGNGRVMGMIRATQDFPDKYDAYRERLRERIIDFGLKPKDVDSVDNPILVRLRITDVDRSNFTQEANSAATLAPSAIENARIDAQKITVGMLQELVVGENQSLEDALRSPKNQAFANRFLKTLPENVQASLVDAKGYLNRDGVHRMAMAVFVSAFQGDTGLRLAEKAFESLDMDVRNGINAIARSLGTLAQAEALIRSGDRDTKLSIGDDLAQAVTVYSAIKHTPALTVEKYLAQGQLLERELTDFQEQVLIVFDNYRRSPRKLGAVLSSYCQKVIDSPPPAQATLIPGVAISKVQLWEDAVRGAEAEIPLFEEVARMLEKTGKSKHGLIPAVKVEITRAEGLISETGKPVILPRDLDIGNVWEAADRILYQWSKTAPTQGYDKCDFLITWEDGETYEGRYDLKHHTVEYPDLAKHIYNFAMFHAGLWKSWMDEKQYRDYLGRSPAADMIPKFQHFLQTYELGVFNAIEDQVIGKAEGANLLAPVKLLTKEIRGKLPPLYSQENVKDPMVWVKFFTPDSSWTWYGIEFDGKDTFFGWVVGHEKEIGYFSLSELASTRGPMGLAIERDKWFRPMPLSEVKKLHEAGMSQARAKLAEFVAQMGNSNTPAGFPLDPRDETQEDMDRFYDWTKRAQPDDILGELCTRADYLGANLCIAKEGDELDKDWIEKCPYIGTMDVYNELGRLRFLCYKLTEKLPSSVMILGKDADLGYSEKESLIRTIIRDEIWLGHLRPDPQPVFDRAKALKKMALSELDKVYRSLKIIMYDVEKEVTKAIYLGMGKKVPAYLTERKDADPCKEISRMLKESPWGAQPMLDWAQRLKILADGAEGCQSLQEKAYEVAFDVIKIAQPMLMPIKVEEAQMGTRRHYFCDWMGHHPHREIIQILSDEEDPKCPYCHRIMTYGAFWGPAQAKAEPAQEEGYEPSVYAARKFGGKLYIFYKHIGSEKEAVKLVNQLYENWNVLAIATPDNDIWLPKKDAPLLINPEFLKRAGLKEAHPYARRDPQWIDVFKTTIVKHYVDYKDCHEGSVRVVKPQKDILVYLGCLKKDKWNAKTTTCSPNPTVVKTIVPNNAKYLKEVKEWAAIGIKVKYHGKEVGIEPKVGEDQEVKEVVEALKNPVEVSE